MTSVYKRMQNPQKKTNPKLDNFLSELRDVNF